MHVKFDDYTVHCRKKSNKRRADVNDSQHDKWDKVRGCRSKVRYKDSELAKMVLVKYPNQRIYFCGCCNGWHLASKSKYVLRIEKEV